MSDSLDRYRQEHQRLANQNLGYDPTLDRVFAHEVRMLGTDADLLRLPPDTSNRQPLQDPVTGTLFFLLGYDDPALSPLPLPPAP